MTFKFMREYLKYCEGLNIEPTMLGLIEYKKYNY